MFTIVAVRPDDVHSAVEFVLDRGPVKRAFDCHDRRQRFGAVVDPSRRGRRLVVVRQTLQRTFNGGFVCAVNRTNVFEPFGETETG